MLSLDSYDALPIDLSRFPFLTSLQWTVRFDELDIMELEQWKVFSDFFLNNLSSLQALRRLSVDWRTNFDLTNDMSRLFASWLMTQLPTSLEILHLRALPIDVFSKYIGSNQCGRLRRAVIHHQKEDRSQSRWDIEADWETWTPWTIIPLERAAAAKGIRILYEGERDFMDVEQAVWTGVSMILTVLETYLSIT